MFGRTVDYRLLRLLVDPACPAWRPADDEAAGLDTGRARARLRKWRARLNGGFPIDPGLRYLDAGCGRGGIAVAMALEGCGHVTGVDLHPRAIRKAREHARRAGVEDKCAFACSDVHALAPERRFDVAVSHEALEHVARPAEFLRAVADRMVQPAGMRGGGGGGRGRLILAFGPLFHSPTGSHASLNFFRFYIPWLVVLFSEHAVLRLRREFFAPADRATRYEDIGRGDGLNRLRYTEFLRYARDAGWEIEFLAVNPQLRRWPWLHRLSELLLRIPVLRDYVAASVYAILRKAAPRERGGQKAGTAKLRGAGSTTSNRSRATR